VCWGSARNIHADAGETAAKRRNIAMRLTLIGPLDRQKAGKSRETGRCIIFTSSISACTKRAWRNKICPYHDRKIHHFFNVVSSFLLTALVQLEMFPQKEKNLPQWV
jgi:hypothetical protein